LVEILLEHCDPSDLSNYCIRQACFNGFTGIVRILLNDPRVDPNINDSYPLRIAIDKDFTLIVELLLNHPRIIVSETLLKYKPSTAIKDLLLSHLYGLDSQLYNQNVL